jgi:hypothetical protein
MKKVVMVVLSLYAIALACLMAASAILNVGQSIEPITSMEALITTLMAVPLIVLGILVIRKPK